MTTPAAKIPMTAPPTNQLLVRFCEKHNVAPVVVAYLIQASHDNLEMVIAMQREISSLKSSLAQEQARTKRLAAEVREHELRWSELEGSPSVRMSPVTAEPNFDGDRS